MSVLPAGVVEHLDLVEDIGLGLVTGRVDPVRVYLSSLNEPFPVNETLLIRFRRASYKHSDKIKRDPLGFYSFPTRILLV